MLRKLLVAAALVGMVAGLAPIRAQASPTDTRAVLVFAGSARVGDGAWTSVTEPAVGEGLCFPGLTATDLNTCVAGGGLVATTNSFSLVVPEQIDPTLPTACVSEGTIGGNSASDDSCGFSIDGYVTANAAGVGPSCGMSQGTSVGGPAADQITVGAGTYTGSIGWITSAGGSIPVNGSVNVGDHTHTVAGYTQARPILGGDCARAPARIFFSAGVLVTTPA